MVALLKTQGELKTWKAFKCSVRFTAMSLKRTGAQAHLHVARAHIYVAQA